MSSTLVVSGSTSDHCWIFGTFWRSFIFRTAKWAQNCKVGSRQTGERKGFGRCLKLLEVSSSLTSKSISSCTSHRSRTACSLRLLSFLISGEGSKRGDALILYFFIIFLIELVVFFVVMYFGLRQLDFWTIETFALLLTDQSHPRQSNWDVFKFAIKMQLTWSIFFSDFLR